MTPHPVPLARTVTTSLAYASTDRTLRLDFPAPAARVLPFTAPIVHDVRQRSAPWYALRCGLVTGSRAYDIHPRRRPSRARADYVAQLVQEQLTQRPHERSFQTAAMRRGVAMEPAAREAYARATGYTVHTTGFLTHATLLAGASLDGHVGDFEGIVEIKAPNTATHLWYGLSGRIPVEYRAQITHLLWLTGAQWCDFVTYDDRVWPAAQRLHVLRVVPDAAHLAWYDGLVRAVDAELRATVDVVRFFREGDLAQAREVYQHCTRVLQMRGGLSLERGAA